MDTHDLGPATRTMTRLLAGVRDDQLTDPTPCPDYTVGDLADHVGGLALAFAAAARKQVLPGSENGGSGDATRLEDGWRDRMTGDLAELADAWADPAAYDGEATAGGVTMPAPVMAQVALNEVVVHGWDLARATGQDFEASGADLVACLAFAEPFSQPGTEELRGTAFGPVVPVPADADDLTRLLGYMGRRA